MRICGVACLGAVLVASVLLRIRAGFNDALFGCPDGTLLWDPCVINGSYTNAQACSGIPCDTSSKAGMVCANYYLCNPSKACEGPICTYDLYYQPPKPSKHKCPNNKTQAIICSSGVLSYGEPDTTFKDKCRELGCQNTEGRVCGNFICGEGAPCMVMCLVDPDFKPFICPDGQTQARLCNVGKENSTFAPQCAALGCPVESYGLSETEGVVCHEVQCGDNAPCVATCLKDPYFNLYRCPGDGQLSHPCMPPTDQAATCKSNCTDLGTACVPLNCSGVCGYACVKDLYYAPLYICPTGTPSAGQLGTTCKPADSAACVELNRQCMQGTFCVFLDCGDGSCSAHCVLDPNYYPPRPSLLVCPGPDNITALTCSSSKNLTADCAALACEDKNLFCVESTCDDGPCKATCVKDPRAYMCPGGSGQVAYECVFPSNKPVKCSADCDQTPGYFCGTFRCGGVCQAVCIKSRYKDAWYEPVLKCDNGAPAQQCTTDNITAGACAAITCPSKSVYVCGSYDCSGAHDTGGSTGGTQHVAVGSEAAATSMAQSDQLGSTDSTAGPRSTNTPMYALLPHLAGRSGKLRASNTVTPSNRSHCKVQCVNDVGGWTRPPQWYCLDGSVANKCGPYVASEVPAPCRPPCDPPRTRCMNAACGASDTCAPTCVFKAEYKVLPCAVGKAVAAGACKGQKDPCNNKNCNTTQRCVPEYCGGCHAACLSTEACKNGNARRACINTANFCMNIKCASGKTCVADQCDGCAAKCVGPCKAGQFVDELHARCTRCPKGLACP